MSVTNKQKDISESKFQVLTNDERPGMSRLNQSPVEDEIDLLALGYALLDRLHYIILCALAGAVLLNAMAFLR